MVIFRAWQETQETSSRDFEIMIYHSDGISRIVLDSFVDALSSLRYPKSIIYLDSFLFRENHTLQIPSFPRLYHTLDSIKELRTMPQDLAYMMEQSEPEGIILFPELETVMIIKVWDLEEDKITMIKPFLTDRRHIAPVKTLCLHPPCWPMCDLQLLDEFEGLCIMWSSVEDDSVQPIEYTCGGIDYWAE